MPPTMERCEIAVILPCYNEGTAIARVVADFRRALPKACIYVFDNDSTDDTAEAAAKAGAFVRKEHRLGKGNVVRRAFAEIDADIYVMADGDGTYDASQSSAMIALLHRERLDMVVGARKAVRSSAYRPGHRFGNRMLNILLQIIMNSPFKDIFSGYRVFSRAFVKSFPALSMGFETETEMTLHALDLRLPVREIDSLYTEAPPGTASKFNTWRDGIRILLCMIYLSFSYRPLFMFGSAGVFLIFLSLAVGIPIVGDYLETGLVARFPTAFAVASTMVIASVCLTSGLILECVSSRARELKRLLYLQHK